MNFESCMNTDYLRACISLKSIIINFEGNYRSAEYEIVVNELMVNYRNMGSRISIKSAFY